MCLFLFGARRTECNPPVVDYFAVCHAYIGGMGPGGLPLPATSAVVAVAVARINTQ